MTSPLHILVVEDDVQMLGYLCALVAGWGFTCEPTKSAAEGIAAAERRCPDVVISDLVMPGMDGLEMLKALRSVKNCSIFFMLITGRGSVTEVVRAIQDGADEVLVKPVNEPDLLAMLRRVEAKRGSGV